MYKSDRKYLKTLEHSRNKFAEVMKVAAEAKAISERYHGQLFHSEAITCAITYVQPKYDYTRDDTKLDYLIKDMFCEVEDVDVRNAVYDSLMLSVKKHYLIYIYNNINDTSRQARVRVLTNLLWHEASNRR